MKKSTKGLFCLTLLLGLLCGCSTPNEEGVEYVVYKKSKNELYKAPIVEDIRWIFLETRDDVLIGESPGLRITDENIYAIDVNGSGKIFRFDHSGRFINTIGTIGRGPNEYSSIYDVVIPENGTVEIFSRPSNAIIRYLFSEDGLFLGRKEYEHGGNVAKTDSAYWVYTGYGNGIRPERLVKIDTSGRELNGFLPSEAKVIHVSERWPFTQNNGRTFMRESFNSVVYELSESGVQPVYRFDFGTLNVPAKYYEYGDLFAAAEALFSQPFIEIQYFAENGKYALIKGVVNKGFANGDDDNVRFIIGIKEKSGGGRWYWFDIESEEDTLFHYPVIALTDKSELYCLVNPNKILSMDDSLKESLFRNEEFKNIQMDDNYIVLVLQLK